MIDFFYSKLQKISPNVPQTMNLYAKFLIEILNDKDAGDDLQKRAKE